MIITADETKNVLRITNEDQDSIELDGNEVVFLYGFLNEKFGLKGRFIAKRIYRGMKKNNVGE